MTVSSMSTGNLTSATLQLLDYCRSRNWAGYDPYDALNSRLFASVPPLNSKIPRLVLTQALKRLPINLRPLLAIPPKQNPKGLALFLSSLIKLAPLELIHRSQIELLISSIIDRLSEARSSSQSCWGYSFPWQTRTSVVPAGTPNLVCTMFVADALFNAHEWNGNKHALAMAMGAVEYILSELYWAEGEKAGFGYPLPSDRNQVHNANLLAAALLCRAHTYTRDDRFLNVASKVARCSVSKQKADGSWLYGEAPSQDWIDNFHTGYNLCALRALARCTGSHEFDSAIQRGFEFYRNHFIRENGVARYFHDRTYPIDIHSVAQTIITLVEFKEFDSGNLALAHTVLGWAMKHMWDKRGFFYYRVMRSHTNRISYMRWSQAWMLLAMSTLLNASHPQSQSEAMIQSAGFAMEIHG